jgi:adenosylcobinamide-GDP ribazoletransferase
MRGFLAALQFLTRIPVRTGTLQDKDLRAAAWFYSAIGLLVGGLLALLNWALAARVPVGPRLVLLLACNAGVTGGLHLDGLADTADGVIGGRTPQQALEIMRDSRIGTFGVLALLGVLALQFAAMYAMPPAALKRALILAPAWGRTAMVVSAASGEPARAEGLGFAFASTVRLRHAIACAAVALFATLIAAARLTAWIVLATGAIVAAFTRYFSDRVGGLTGDTLGTINEATETAVFWIAMLAR